MHGGRAVGGGALEGPLDTVRPLGEVKGVRAALWGGEQSACIMYTCVQSCTCVKQ